MAELRIVAAAIRVGNIIVTAPQPARHGHLLEAAHKIEGDVIVPEQFGFLTSAGKFADRKRARRIAVEAEQLLPRHHPGLELFSEDVW